MGHVICLGVIVVLVVLLLLQTHSKAGIVKRWRKADKKKPAQGYMVLDAQKCTQCDRALLPGEVAQAQTAKHAKVLQESFLGLFYWSPSESPTAENTARGDVTYAHADPKVCIARMRVGDTLTGGL